jgi:sugar (pentulose or hexulose) kinase
VPLAVGRAAEGPALGAAILAQVGCGVVPGLVDAVAASVPRPAEAVAPSSELVELYRSAHARYRALYPALKAALA